MTQALRFDPDGRDLAALRFGTPGGKRVLALHGWLDNAASFAPLAALLPEFDWIALEFAGHGHSAHRPPHTWYHYVDYIDDVACALRELGWERCSIVGHSLGGAVACAFAAAAAERVERLALIESAGPLSGKPGKAAELVRTSLREREAFDPTRNRVFADMAPAVKARMQAGGISERVAQQLLERNTVAVDGGFAWRSDPRLKLTSPARLHEDIIREWLRAIACPVLAIAADPPFPMQDETIRAARLACLTDARLVILPGNHHLHMENPEPVAATLRDFLARVPKL